MTDPAETEAKLGDRATEEHDLGISPELETALDQLGPRERELIGLRFGADMSTGQIADLTNLSAANVQQILSRSLRRLRAALEEAAEHQSATSGAYRRAGTGPV